MVAMSKRSKAWIRAKVLHTALPTTDEARSEELAAEIRLYPRNGIPFQEGVKLGDKLE